MKKFLLGSVISICLVWTLLWLEDARAEGLYMKYHISWEALRNVSTVQSVGEWLHREVYQKKEYLSHRKGCGELYIVDNFEDFIGKEFPGCLNNPKWGGFVLYPAKHLSRFNFPLSGMNIFSINVHWAQLNIWAYNYYLWPPEKYFPLSNMMAIYGTTSFTESLNELEKSVNNPDIYEEAKNRFFGSRGLEFLNTPPTTTLRKVRKKDQVTIVCDPVSDFIGFIRPDGTPISVHASPLTLKHNYKTNLEYFHAQ